MAYFTEGSLFQWLVTRETENMAQTTALKSHPISVNYQPARYWASQLTFLSPVSPTIKDTVSERDSLYKAPRRVLWTEKCWIKWSFFFFLNKSCWTLVGNQRGFLLKTGSVSGLVPQKQPWDGHNELSSKSSQEEGKGSRMGSGRREQEYRFGSSLTSVQFHEGLSDLTYLAESVLPWRMGTRLLSPPNPKPVTDYRIPRAVDWEKDSQNFLAFHSWPRPIFQERLQMWAAAEGWALKQGKGSQEIWVTQHHQLLPWRCANYSTRTWDPLARVTAGAKRT